jgi:hypothetical protein
MKVALLHPGQGVGHRLERNVEEAPMAKGQRKSNKEIRKPKKQAPPKQNASNPTLKGAPAALLSKG